MNSDSAKIVSMEEEKGEQKPIKNKLECDLSAYILFQEGKAGAPCLSFDILKDNLGDSRTCDTPLTCYIVMGSQADQTDLNIIQLLKISNMHKVETDKDSSYSESDDDREDKEESKEDKTPVISSVFVGHEGCVNRIRAVKYNDTTLAAAWSELGWVSIWDLGPFLEAVDNPEVKRQFLNDSPPYLYADGNNGIEGFALDWSPTMPGTLATGDCNKLIKIWQPQEGGRWSVSSEPYSAHTNSVEDIQWSPSERHVFASCSVDKSLRIWDARVIPSKACMLTCEDAHASDVNVIHWSRCQPFIASGGDDSKVLIWDIRKLQTKTPVAHLQYHGAPVCSVEWHPEDSSVLASAGEDDDIIQWDLAVERDEEEMAEEKEDRDIPQQLLFIHQGQKEIKEVHWHQQVPGLMISTAHTGFNVFKTISC